MTNCITTKDGTQFYDPVTLPWGIVPQGADLTDFTKDGTQLNYPATHYVYRHQSSCW